LTEPAAKIEVPETLRAALADRYLLERPIGQGGAATVYLAHDKKHGRQVAVKVLRSDLSAALGTERFLREIEIAARLQHPHILLLIDSGEADGRLYYVMPYIAGESLRARLDRRGRLDPSEALGIAREVGDALDYAHRHGVVHRDIKPENVLLSDGHAVVADFGVAKALTVAADRNVTRTGYPVGTIGYMSPEQAAGDTQLDARSDCFSLAVVCYEMLVGVVPGRWMSDESTRVLRFLDAPADHRAILDRLPGRAEQVLVKGLDLRAGGRYESSRQLTDALALAFGDRPRYREEQVSDIVARAAELEAGAPTASGTLSLGGIERLAADVGIPPTHVERAARELTELSSRTQPKANPFLGSASRIVIERVIEGELSEDEYPILVDEIRITIGNVGQASTLGRSLAWRTVNPPNQVGRSVTVTVNPIGDRTRIRIDESLRPVAGGLFGGLMGGMGGVSIALGTGLGIGALHSAVVALLIPIMGVGSAWGLARTFLRMTLDKRRDELQNLMDRLASYAEQSIRTGRRPRLPR
jgi:serine/threonine protein kinase